MRGERGQVVSVRGMSREWGVKREGAYVIKFVRMFIDMPSWSRTLGIWSIKSSKGIA